MDPVSPFAPATQDTPPQRTTEKPPRDSAPAAGELDLDSYELGEALKQIHSSEQRLKRELRELRESNSTLADENSRAQARLKSLEEELALAQTALNSREAQVRAFSSTRASQTAREIEERKYLKEQLEKSHEKSDQLTQQYDELYQYCEALLADSEKKRKGAESRAQEVTANFQELEKHAKQLETHYSQAAQTNTEFKAAIAVRELEFKELQASTQSEIAHLKKSYEEARQAFEQSKGKSNRTRLENSSLETRLALLEQAYQAAVPNNDRARDGLGKSTKTLEDLQRAIKKFFEQASQRGITPVTLKAGKLMAEQMRIEVENLRRLDPLLRDLSDAFASIDALALTARQAQETPEGHA